MMCCFIAILMMYGSGRSGWHCGLIMMIRYGLCHLYEVCCSTVVDGEKLRAVLLINPTKSTLLPILNRGEVGPKKTKADLLYLVQQATDTSSIFSNQTTSQSLSPKPSEPNLIKTLILDS